MKNKLFKNPSPIFLIFIYLITLVSAIVSVVLSSVESDNITLNVIRYIAYIVAAVGFAYSIYTFIAVLPKMKKKFFQWTEKYEFTNNLARNYGMRTIVFAVGSFIISAGYGAYNFTLSVIERSIWYGVLAGYYILLAFMRGGVVFYHKNRRKRERIGKFCDEESKRVKKYRDCGALLIVASFALIAAVLQMTLSNATFTHAGLMIYVSAAYTFYKVTMSIINIVRAKKHSDMTVKAIRNINLADAAVSVLALQTSMMHSFGQGDSAPYSATLNAVTGSAVFAFVLALGIYMVAKSKRLLAASDDEGCCYGATSESLSDVKES